jgi:hypothetical protein
MAPTAIDDNPAPAKSGRTKPLKLSGALNDFDYVDVTPAIGREFPKASLAEWLNAPNADDLIRDLAITSAKAKAPCDLQKLT